MQFTGLDDSPMFRKQIQLLEDDAESLRERSLKFCKGCRKYTEGLGEAYDGDIAFASSLEMFGGGHNDPISVAFGGPVMTKFTIALREIGTYKEVLRSQVEHILNDRLLQFVNIDLQDVKEAHKRFDKESLIYDQAREKFLSLRKGTKMGIVAVSEEELYNARSSFEQARFNLVSALSNVEAKKRFEFLEAVCGTMDAHLRYFKQGYELLHQMEPYMNQVLAYAQQSRERANYDQAALAEKMQEYKRQIDRESRWSANGCHGSPNGDGIQTIGRSSHKMIEEVMQSSAKGKVQVIRQGYLSKRSSNLRGDWKRRFFVLDSRGMLYYYRKQYGKPSGSGSQSSIQRSNHSAEHGPGLLSRWLSLHHHGGAHDEKSGARHTVNLLTSTIKVDAEQSDLRFCFRIISPAKNYTLQAESALDQMDWIEKITGVIASLLSFQTPELSLSYSPMSSGNHQHTTSESSSVESSSEIDHATIEECTSERNLITGTHEGSVRGAGQHRLSVKHEKPIEILRKVDGNDKCADCAAPEPDWASLNLGILLCIECSGVHRNLGVHISKVRSLTLDVKVWEPSVINLFQSLGNEFANSIWESQLHCVNSCSDGISTGSSKSERKNHLSKPTPSDSISAKEKYIHAKYAEKAFVQCQDSDQSRLSVAQQMWDAVRANDKKTVYRLIIVDSSIDVNAIRGQVTMNASMTLASVVLLDAQEKSGHGRDTVCPALADTLKTWTLDGSPSVPASRGTPASADWASDAASNLSLGDTNEYGSEVDEGIKVCSLLHLACQATDIGMVELLLQYGANINATDSQGQTPLHHCILNGNSTIAKLLIARGVNTVAVDRNGKTPLQAGMEAGTFTDEELFVILQEPNK